MTDPVAPTTPTDAPSTVPNRAGSSFSTEIYAWFAWQVTNVAELFGLATNAHTNATAANERAVLTAADVVSTGLNVTTATAQANIAIAATNFKGAWSSLTGALATPATVLHNNNYWMLLGNLADVTASEPGVTADWSLVDSKSLHRSARSSNTILGTADKGNLIDITSGTFSQTFTASATLGSGWFCYIRNSGTGDITLDPNASETIDGLTSYVMYPGETRLVQCDGTGFNSAVLSSFHKDFTATGTFTKPPGYSAFGGLAWSGGASGQRTNNASAISTGGSGGGCFPFTIPSSLFGATETITVGAGGLPVTDVGGALGLVGGNTTIGALLTVFAGNSARAGGAIGVTTAFTTTDSVPNGFEASMAATTAARHSIFGGTSSSATISTVGGSSIYGGAVGGSLTAAAAVLDPGTSKFGGNGGAASSASNGSDGAAPGGGGGATQTGTQSGAGARGEVRIWGIA